MANVSAEEQVIGVWCDEGCILLSDHIDCYVPSREWPEGFQMLEEIVRHIGTDWVRNALTQIEQENVSE